MTSQTELKSLRMTSLFSPLQLQNTEADPSGSVLFAPYIEEIRLSVDRCEHGKFHCKTCHPNYFCPHGRQAYQCRECGGKGFCEHDRQRRYCGLCSGASIFKSHLGGALGRGLINELTERRYRWLVLQPCIFCGGPAGGVDRFKNTYGYTVLNSVPSCFVCNSLKSTRSAPDFIEHVVKIAAHTSTYEIAKLRWTNTRTTGPDLEVT